MDNQSLSHVRWKCQNHIVFIPKFRKNVLYHGYTYLHKVPVIKRDMTYDTIPSPLVTTPNLKT